MGLWPYFWVSTYIVGMPGYLTLRKGAFSALPDRAERGIDEKFRNQKRVRFLMSASPVPVENLSFESALKELEGIVSRLEQGQVDLEDSIALYERGQALKAQCEERLRLAESRLETIVRDGGGQPVAQAGGAEAHT